MAKEELWYVLECHRCLCRLAAKDKFGYRTFDDAGEVDEAAKEHGWTKVKEDLHLCPRCKGED